METKHEYFGFLQSPSIRMKTVGIGFIICVIAAVVFANQTVAVFATSGRVLHLLSIGLAVSTLLIAFGYRGAIYTGVCAGLYVIGLFGFREPYLIALCVLFLTTGTLLAGYNQKTVTGTFVAITLASGAMMFLQLLGVGEWTQLLTTHGIVDDAFSLPKAPDPTLFLGYGEVQANFLQGRPAGLLHSNQFASLIVLVTFALSMSCSKNRSILVDVALCVTAVLTMSKVVFLGLALLVAFYFVYGQRDGRRLAIRFSAMTAAALAAYAALFPGMFQIFLFNPSIFLQSVAVRIADIGAETFGWSSDQIDAYLRSIADRIGATTGGAVSIDDRVIQRIAESEAYGRVTTYSVLLPFWRFGLSIFLAAICILSVNAEARRAVAGWLRRSVTKRHVAVVIVIATFCLAANFLESPLFWFLVGFAVPVAVFEGASANRSGRPSMAAHH